LNASRACRPLAGLLIALCLAAGAAGSAGGAAYSKDSQLVEHWNGTKWTKARAPGPNGDSRFTAATAISATDVWAVGTNWAVRTSPQTAPDPAWTSPIAARWNGSSWQTMRLPTPHRTWPFGLDAVSASAANDVWAVGGSAAGTLIEQWNGKNWRLVVTPDRLAFLDRVVALSPHNVWLVGYRANGHDERTRALIEHWNGRAWRRAATPNPRGGVIGHIAASSAHNIWAVGEYRSRRGFRPLLLHWNGFYWRRVAGPTLPHPADLWDVVAVGAHDFWAVGEVGLQPLAEHWNGRRWRVVSVPVPKGSGGISLDSVAAVSAQDVWAVGSSGYQAKTVAAHWDGKSWTIVPTAGPGKDDGLLGVAAVATGDVWAVGSSSAP
jgi:hypothetical protein